MASRRQVRLVPTLLDRLIVEDQSGRIGSTRPDSFKALLDSISRDLHVLLNTRRGELLVPEGFTEAAGSILNFGLTDFVSYSLKSPLDQERLRRALETTICRFEPRLSRVAVALAGWDELNPVLRFRVEAVLSLAEASEPVVFETSFQVDSGKFRVVEGRS